MNLRGHIWKIQEKWKFMQKFFWLFKHHCLVNVGQNLVTASFLSKGMLFTFLLSVRRPGKPFPWWGVLAPPRGTQPEFRSGELHQCHRPRRDAHHLHLAGKTESGWRGGRETCYFLFDCFSFFSSSGCASFLKISPMTFHILNSLLPSMVIWLWKMHYLDFLPSHY